MNRIQASSWHLFFSACIGALFFSIFWLVWYPAPTFSALGVLPIFLMLIGIDVVLGPLMTLIVYKPHKKNLKFDLSAIALVQATALIYGVSTMLEARPVYIASLGEKFQIIQATEITDTNLAKANAVLSWTGPQWVGTRAPVELADKDAIEMLAMVGAGRGHLPQLHTPYATMAPEVLEHALPISKLRALNPNHTGAIDSWLKKHGATSDTTRYLPLIVGPSHFAVFVNAKTAAVIGMAAFNTAGKLGADPEISLQI